MKIDLLITGLGLGGAEVQVVNLARAFSRMSHDVRVISMTPSGIHAEELRQEAIPYTCLGMRRGLPDPRGIHRLRAVLKARPPDVLHSHMVHANLLARATRVLHRIPVLVCTAHNTFEGGRWREHAYRFTDSLADVTTNVSQAALTRYLRIKAITAARARYVPNGIDLTRLEPPSRERRLDVRRSLGVSSEWCWLWAGRMVREKNPCGAVEAFAVVRHVRPEARLWLVGDGPEAPRVRERVARLGLSESVACLGVRRDVAALMSAADGLVCSSDVEGLPMVLLEAAGSGLPIVTTSAGGCGEAVADGRTGRVVERPQLLPSAMLSVMALDRAALSRMGEAARAHVREHYSLPVVAGQWIQLYAELMGRRSARGPTREADEARAVGV